MRSVFPVLISVLLAAIVSWAVVKTTIPASAIAAKESVFDRVMRTGTIRCGYFIQDSLLTKDGVTGAIGGPGHDIIEAMAHNLSLKVEWVAEVGFASIGEDLKRGRYDMMCTPFVPNGPRARSMDMSRTVFFQLVTIWLHKDDPRFSRTDQSWLNQPATKFITVDGTAFTTIVKNYFPKATLVALPEVTPLSDMSLELAHHKVDAMLMSHYNAVKYAERNNGVIKQYSTRVINTPPYQFAWAKGESKLATMVNMTLEELIYNGVVDAILETYDPGHSYYKRVVLSQ